MTGVTKAVVCVILCVGWKEGRKEMFYLMMHSTYFIYGYMASERVWDDAYKRTLAANRKE